MKSYWYENKKKENKLVARIRKMLDLQLFTVCFSVKFSGGLSIFLFWLALLASGHVPNYENEMKRVIHLQYSKNLHVVPYSSSICRPAWLLLIYAGAVMRPSHTYLCVVELRLHVQWLQNLIEKRLQTESWSFLTLDIHLSEKKMETVPVFLIMLPRLKCLHKLSAGDHKAPNP